MFKSQPSTRPRRSVFAFHANHERPLSDFNPSLQSDKTGNPSALVVVGVVVVCVDGWMDGGVGKGVRVGRVT